MNRSRLRSFRGSRRQPTQDYDDLPWAVDARGEDVARAEAAGKSQSAGRMPDEAILYRGDSNHEIRALLASWRPNSGSHRSIPGLSLRRTERARLWESAKDATDLRIKSLACWRAIDLRWNFRKKFAFCAASNGGPAPSAAVPHRDIGRGRRLPEGNWPISMHCSRTKFLSCGAVRGRSRAMRPRPTIWCRTAFCAQSKEGRGFNLPAGTVRSRRSRGRAALPH